jgi:hypothetical protein
MLLRWWTLLIAALFLTGCESGTAPEPGAADEEPGVVKVAAKPTLATIGHGCRGDHDCNAGERCFPDMGPDGHPVCACDVGFTGCGNRCIDTLWDDDNCSGCGAQCPVGERCINGSCRTGAAEDPAASTMAPLGSVDPQQKISRSPTNECHDYGEAVVERAASGSRTEMFTLYNFNFVNYATDWNLWQESSTLWPLPSGEPTAGTWGDPWATQSGLTGLLYGSMLLHDSATGYDCIGVAASDYASLASNTWYDQGAKCINDLNPNTDGPAIVYDPGAYNFWAVDTNPHKLYVFANCTSGPPRKNSPTCGLTRTLDVGEVTYGAYRHSNVKTSPCGHYAVVAYRNTAWQTKLRFFSTTGQIAQYQVPGGPFRPRDNDYCADDGSSCVGSGGPICKCGGYANPDCGGPGCIKVVYKVQLATTFTGNRCYAYLAYDTSDTDASGHSYLYGKLDIVDITYPSSAHLVRSWASRLPGRPWNEYNSTISVQGPNFAWFVTSQDQGACGTRAWVALDASGGINNMTWYTMSDHYPSVRWSDGHGQSDYTRAASLGLPLGYLFTSWEQPVTFTGVNPNGYCRQCQGTWYTSTIQGARVKP